MDECKIVATVFRAYRRHFFGMTDREPGALIMNNLIQTIE